ncbi:hypothetical protein OV079_15715 [Nannocystis pusilla]|uniref:Uncharacterized protein n=1 Tax=Nannocystis pusilla TaxID=889268 RepID=A0A9X3EWS4_9BACT|nr:hypothetical protein [Nannocystis pusilla]
MIPQHPRAALDERASERGPILAAHVELARVMVLDAGFEVRSILRAIEAAIAEEAWPRVVSLVRVAKVVEPSGESLAATLGWLREHAGPGAGDPVFSLLVEALPADAPIHASFATALHRAGNPLARGFYENFWRRCPSTRTCSATSRRSSATWAASTIWPRRTTNGRWPLTARTPTIAATSPTSSR